MRTNFAIESYTNFVMMLGWFFVLSFQSLHIQKTWKLVPSTLTKLVIAKYHQLTAFVGFVTEWQSSDIERRKSFKMCVLPRFHETAEGKQVRNSTAVLLLWLARSFSIVLNCLCFSWNCFFQVLWNWTWMISRKFEKGAVIIDTSTKSKGFSFEGLLLKNVSGK